MLLYLLLFSIFFIFSFPQRKDCSFRIDIVKKAFTIAKINSLKEPTELEFFDGEIKINRIRIKSDFILSVPKTEYKACGNEKGEISQKTKFYLKDGNVGFGSVYISACGKNYAVSVAPSGYTKICEFKGKWEVKD